MRDVDVTANVMRKPREAADLELAGLSSVNLSGNMRDSPLVNRRSIPSLDSAEIGFARLVSPTSAPAMSPEEISRGSQGVGGVIEIAAGAVVQDALGQELCLADLPVH